MVVPVEFVVGLGFIVREASSLGRFDDEEIEYNNNQDEGCERIEHEL